MSAAPIKIGILIDGPEVNPDTPMIRAMQMKIDPFNEAGGVGGHPVEMTFAAANAAHAGVPENTIPAWYALADQSDVVGIIGPAIADNCLTLPDIIDSEQLPTICWPGSELCRNEWYFQFQAGSFSDETLYLVRLLAKLGHRRIGVLEAGTVGNAYFAHFEREARFAGLVIAGHEYAHVHETDVVSQMTNLKEIGPDAVVFLGMGEPTMAYGRALKAMDWSIPRFANIAMLSLAAMPPDVVSGFEGMTWVDQYEPRNPVLAKLENEYEKRYSETPPPLFMLAIGADMMTLMLEGLRRATHLSRPGLKAGLERVKQIPCATGGLNPVMGFCKWDRQAIKGPDIMMYRRVRNGTIESYDP